MGQFDGKVVMITGAAGGIGSAVVEKFAREGAKVVLADRSGESYDKVVSRLGGQIGDYLIVSGDIGQVDVVDEMVEKAIAKFGQIDALAHIAGGFSMGDPVHAVNVDVFEKMMYINARLTYVICGRVAKHMVESGVHGTITAVLARAGLTGGKNMAAYSASKAAAERIIQSMAQELKDHDIRVNGVMPSIVDTEPNRNDMPKADFSKWVTPAQIADVIAFLSSPAGSSVTGGSIPVYNKV
ncbi:MAG: SDR family NAD(P)-dependent oxidoreductase [Anaerolineae bacterium]|nr:SDR family NAD(P)-dependent oxidoreductase [Anaerolineae bacterium]